MYKLDYVFANQKLRVCPMMMIVLEDAFNQAVIVCLAAQCLLDRCWGPLELVLVAVSCFSMGSLYRMRMLMYFSKLPTIHLSWPLHCTIPQVDRDITN